MCCVWHCMTHRCVVCVCETARRVACHTMHTIACDTIPIVSYTTCYANNTVPTVSYTAWYANNHRLSTAMLCQQRGDSPLLLNNNHWNACCQTCCAWHCMASCVTLYGVLRDTVWRLVRGTAVSHTTHLCVVRDTVWRLVRGTQRMSVSCVTLNAECCRQQALHSPLPQQSLDSPLLGNNHYTRHCPIVYHS